MVRINVTIMAMIPPFPPFFVGSGPDGLSCLTGGTTGIPGTVGVFSRSLMICFPDWIGAVATGSGTGGMTDGCAGGVGGMTGDGTEGADSGMGGTGGTTGDGVGLAASGTGGTGGGSGGMDGSGSDFMGAVAGSGGTVGASAGGGVDPEMTPAAASLIAFCAASKISSAIASKYVQ